MPGTSVRIRLVIYLENSGGKSRPRQHGLDSHESAGGDRAQHDGALARLTKAERD